MNVWAKGILGSIIGGAAGAVTTYLATFAAGTSVPVQALGYAALLGALSHLAAYLSESPVPK